MKDVIETIPLEDGFVLMYTEEGYFLCMISDNGMETLLRIDRETYNCISKREAKICKQ